MHVTINHHLWSILISIPGPQIWKRTEDLLDPKFQMFLKDSNGGPEYKVVGNDLHSFSSEKQEKRTRNKDRPDRGVWTPLHRSDRSHASDESLFIFCFSIYTVTARFCGRGLQTTTPPPARRVQPSPLYLQMTHCQAHPNENGKQGCGIWPYGIFPQTQSHGEVKMNMSNARSGETRTVGAGRSSYPPLDNGSHKHSGRRGLVHNVKDDGSSIISDGKLLKRGGSSGYVPHEKQVWVQKSSAGS
ncbi:Smg-4/UPF3 family protein [Actinidia rufa]|uniref:Smg-4/UPF3 family protein n=1 Tax=Actinidia rufa TaxID=165716 RepID=A0A7J0EQN7_9ERIC|nr:Smg-4/UPF3 family protein [Actinidia rufa]